jgi:hypothetical protein
MAIHFTTTVQDEILFVTASGFDENLAQVQEYGMAIITACLETGVTHILCNEIDLEYRLDIFDTFQAAEFIAANAPHVGRIALVCNPKYLADARFWEDVAVNRGLTARMFKDMDTAILWLKHQMPSSKG